MDKAIIKQSIIAQQEEAVETLRKAVEQYQEEADIDEQEGQDPQDYSHQEEATDLWRRMETQLKIAESDLARIQSIPLEKVEKVKVGSLIETDYLNFFVGISSLPFQIDDRKVIGISTHAPIYLQLKGKKEGDRVSIGKKEYKIRAVS